MSTKEFPSSELEIPQGAHLELAGDSLIAKGTAGEVKRRFPKKELEIKINGNKVIVQAKRSGSLGRMLVGTWSSHIKNMASGVLNPFTYKLKVVYSHFPISVSLSNKEFVVQNFLGEKKAHKYIIPNGVNVTVKDNIVTVSSSDIELAGQAATRIEQLCKVRNKDRRIFQDGIYIIERPK